METQQTTKKEIKPEISFDDFLKADIRICEIISVERVENTDKLYKLIIKTGIDERVVISAIAHRFDPEHLLNKKFPFVLNLPPRKIKGIESFGMIILAEDSTGNVFQIGDQSSSEVGAIVI